MDAGSAKLHNQSKRIAHPLGAEAGFTLIEILVAMVVMLIIVSATMEILGTTTAAQSRDQAYGSEVTATQTALARLTHDVRQATGITQVTPSVLQFQILSGGVTYNVRYDCTAPDTLGSAYHRCARTSAPASSQLPAYTSTPSSLDLQHLANGNSTTFCNSSGTAQSGVFMIANPAVANTSGSGLACDEAYETILTNQLGLIPPTYIQVLALVPASGSLSSGGLSHQTSLQAGTFLPNMDPGA